MEEYSKADILGVYATNVFGMTNYVMLIKGIDWEDLVLPIYIGAHEAASIEWALKGYVHKRPMTHDLMVNVLEVLNVKIEKITIDAMIDNIYTATIFLYKEENGRKIRYNVDARPSDSVALALRAGAPIYIANRLKSYAVSESSISLVESEE
ncbi:MAG: bifunctional nuclease family protein [Thermoprotei archaeon]|nr:MAG: bifunctional nuclease family protein [Thermoprotei archaeon]